MPHPAGVDDFLMLYLWNSWLLVFHTLRTLESPETMGPAGAKLAAAGQEVQVGRHVAAISGESLMVHPYPILLREYANRPALEGRPLVTGAVMIRGHVA